MQTKSVSNLTPLIDEERPLLASIKQRFADTVGNGVPLFTTDAPDLWAKFLFLLPEDMRQQYTCRACQRFVGTYGGLAVIDEAGKVVSAMWQPIEGPFFDALTCLQQSVNQAKITGVFLSGDRTWGTPINRDSVRARDWHHMHVQPPAACVRAFSAVKSDSQHMAERLEEFSMLRRGLEEFPVDIIRNAHTLLTTGQLSRSEKCEAVAKWLLELQENLTKLKNTSVRDNLIWAKVASAPAGWCHVRGGMIGTLLEDLTEGLDFTVIKRKWDKKMHPLQYLRPQAAPSAGNIAQAEKVIAALKTAGSLERRFAQLKDCELLWKPISIEREPSDAGGVFSHLKPKEKRGSAQPVEAPPVTMTWEKFMRTVLPEAQSIELLIPHENSSFIALVTATNPDSPPILQWDREERRNQVSWYLYSSGSHAGRWNLPAGQWHPVTGITLLPSQWHGQGLPSQGEGVILLLKDARDLEHNAGGGMFPESMRSEYHPIRATIERYFQTAVISGKDEASACGLDLRKGGRWNATIRVTSKAGRVTYKLDRWD